MRLPIERATSRGLAVALILSTALAGCGRGHADLASAPLPAALANGPAADYPVVVGAPYRVGDKTYTPVDTLNYDEVGYVAASGGTGITGWHHTLPLPSYVEVTSLVTGHTILVRIEHRGPMDGDAVVALSPAAIAQLGATPGDPVRVRRVNPPEAERAALRAGRTAPARMDTPGSLLAVLKQKLPAQGSVNLAEHKPNTPTPLASVDVPPSLAKPSPPPSAAEPAPVPVHTHGVARSSPPPLPPLKPQDGSAALAVSAAPRADAASKEPAASHPAAPSAATSRDGAYIVQAAALSTIERARKVAGEIGGSVSQAGAYYRVRTGPFATREQAEASLAKVRAAGYSDARIFTNG